VHPRTRPPRDLKGRTASWVPALVSDSQRGY
jgi:hypothetical protein